jgi:hypothetical protein
MISGFVLRCAALGLIALSVATGTVAGAPANSTNKLAKIAIPGKPIRSFDIGWVDPAAGRYYLADRTNAAIDVVDTTTNSFVGQIGGFKGATGTGNTSGPNGVVVTFSGRELWAGDGDSTVKVVDLNTGSVVASVSTGGKKRADELAYDPNHNVMLVANDAEDPPFLTFISVASRSVVGKIEFPGADGLEQPTYDASSGLFYQAIPATKENPGGEVAAIDPVKMSVTARYPLTRCAPHGLISGPPSSNQLLVGCSAAMHTVIIDKTNGATLADFTQLGSSDEVWFNPGENRYYLAENAPQALGVIDAQTLAFVENVQTGVGAHSVAADSTNNHIFVPIAAPDPACPDSCIAVYASVNGDGNGLTAK